MLCHQSPVGFQQRSKMSRAKRHLLISPQFGSDIWYSYAPADPYRVLGCHPIRCPKTIATEGNYCVNSKGLRLPPEQTIIIFYRGAGPEVPPGS